MFLADGSPNMAQWLSARFGWRHSTAAMLVRVALRLRDLPLLKARFAAGELSLEQVDAISRMATPETEAGLIGECLGCQQQRLIVPRAEPIHPPRSGPMELENLILLCSWHHRFLHEHGCPSARTKRAGQVPLAGREGLPTRPRPTRLPARGTDSNYLGAAAPAPRPARVNPGDGRKFVDRPSADAESTRRLSRERST